MRQSPTATGAEPSAAWNATRVAFQNAGPSASRTAPQARSAESAAAASGVAVERALRIVGV